MSKFLKIVNENQPPNPNAVFHINLTDEQGNVLDSVKVRGTAYATDMFLNLKDRASGAAEDEEGEVFLQPDQEQALKTASSLVSNPRSRFMQRNPKKEVEKALGDMYTKVARKVTDISRKIK